MFRQKQTPRGNNPTKICSTSVKQKQQQNTHTEEWSPQCWICNSIEITSLHRLPPFPNRLQTHKTMSQKNISGGLPLYWYLILKLNFVKRNLLKVKNSWDHWSCDYLMAVVVENVSIHKLTKFPCKWSKYE